MGLNGILTRSHDADIGTNLDADFVLSVVEFSSRINVSCASAYRLSALAI